MNKNYTTTNPRLQRGKMCNNSVYETGAPESLITPNCVKLLDNERYFTHQELLNVSSDSVSFRVSTKK